ncbi:MAG: hypothetical protein GF383_06080 [Candidatus Lokiarchaeota archaeon]|nr:hypothetical protein [Candidatus Lokiarchaeota archaeon]
MTEDHSEIFSGFLTAIQKISEELNIGNLVLISTEGEKGHNCIVVPQFPINFVLLVDQEDPVHIWKEIGADLAQRFLKKFQPRLNSHDFSQYEEFLPTIKKICSADKYCE